MRDNTQLLIEIDRAGRSVSTSRSIAKSEQHQAKKEDRWLFKKNAEENMDERNHAFEE